MIAIWQIIPSLRVGNTVILKPSEYTPLGTLEMVRLINEVLPPGVLNTVSGGGTVGDALVRHPDVREVMFTGSGATGRKIIEASAGNMARLTLELGGNDAAIVLPDADPPGYCTGAVLGCVHQHGPNLCLRQAAVCA